MLHLLAAALLAAGAGPATTAEAARVLDLAEFPLPGGEPKVGTRTLGELSYDARGSVRDEFTFVRNQLLQRGWTELPGSNVTDQSASETFRREGYTVSVMAYPSDGRASVQIKNQGNVDLGAMPFPAGATPLIDMPIMVTRLVPGAPDDVAAGLAESLRGRGWVAYGSAGRSRYYKQNAVLLHARVDAAPAHGGKTFVEYTAELLSADLPAPDGADQLRYDDSIKRLSFVAKDKPEAVHAFYAGRLTTAGWTPTTDNPVADGKRLWRIYRNRNQELIDVTVETRGGRSEVAVKHQTAREVAESEERARAAAAKKAAQGKASPTVVLIRLPDGARDVTTAKGRLEFQTPGGGGKAAADAVRAALRADGWAEKKPLNDTAQFGHVDLTKGDLSLTVSFIDPGPIPGKVTITGLRVELKTAK